MIRSATASSRELRIWGPPVTAQNRVEKPGWDWEEPGEDAAWAVGAMASSSALRSVVYIRFPPCCKNWNASARLTKSLLNPGTAQSGLADTPAGGGAAAGVAAVCEEVARAALMGARGRGDGETGPWACDENGEVAAVFAGVAVAAGEGEWKKKAGAGVGEVRTVTAGSGVGGFADGAGSEPVKPRARSGTGHPPQWSSSHTAFQ